MSFPTLKAFIFDMDGTLVDSKLDFDAMRAELKFPEGVPLLEHIDEIRGQVSEDEVQYFFDVIHRHEREGALASELMPGVVDFLEFLNEAGIHTAVLTRNNREVTDLTFDKWDLSFSKVLSRDCIVRQKPHPEGLLKICEELEVGPHQSVYMGDFSFDLQAAKNAAMKAILYSPEENRELESEADLTVRCYKELRDGFERTFLEPLGLSLPN